MPFHWSWCSSPSPHFMKLVNSVLGDVGCSVRRRWRITGTDLRGLSNDVYFQVGLLTTIGLSAKNAILIVEFAVEMMQKEGKTPVEAIIEAARMRLRPILMTSLAFILGVLPLVISHGAGSGAQNAVGTGVMGGMFAATVLAIYFVPVFFVVVEHLFARFKKA